MTKYNKNYEYVTWNDLDNDSCKKAQIKKSKLENQGYTLIATNPGFYENQLIYKKRSNNENYKS